MLEVGLSDLPTVTRNILVAQLGPQRVLGLFKPAAQPASHSTSSDESVFKQTQLLRAILI